MPVAGGASKTAAQKNEERLGNLKKANEKRAADKQAAIERGEVPAKREKAAKVPHACKCGCGQQTGGHFYPGHDARFKGWLLQIERGKMQVNELPDSVQKSYTWVEKGKGKIPTTNYKGEPHTGYDKE